MQINVLIKNAHENAVKKGFWEDAINFENKAIANKVNSISDVYISQFLMLIVGEVSEAQEGLRKKDYENFAEELADIAIRLADLCGGLGIDLDTEIRKKMDKNKNRPYKHGKSF